MEPTFRILGTLLMSACLGLAMGGDAEARSLGTSVAKAAQKRVLSDAGRNAATNAKATQTPRQPGAQQVASGRPRDVIIRRSRNPETAAHIERAQTSQPTVLTLDRKHAELRRQESLRHVHRRGNSVVGKDRDEYPPAMVREGGFNADVAYVKAKDNRAAGRSVANQVRDLPDGAHIRVLVAD